MPFSATVPVSTFPAIPPMIQIISTACFVTVRCTLSAASAAAHLPTIKTVIRTARTAIFRTDGTIMEKSSRGIVKSPRWQEKHTNKANEQANCGLLVFCPERPFHRQFPFGRQKTLFVLYTPLVRETLRQIITEFIPQLRIFHISYFHLAFSIPKRPRTKYLVRLQV